MDNWSPKARQLATDEGLCVESGGIEPQDAVTGACGTSAFYLVPDSSLGIGMGWVYQSLSSNSLVGPMTAIYWGYEIIYSGNTFDNWGSAFPNDSYWSRNGVVDAAPGNVVGWMWGDVYTFNGFTCTIDNPSAAATF